MAFTVKGLRELQRDYEKAARTSAAAEARGLRRVAVTIIKNQSQQIRATVNLKAAVVKKAIETKTKPTAEQLRIVHEVRGKGISLIEFGGLGSWKGATAKVLVKSGRKKVRGGFLTAAPEGGRQIWARSGEAKRRMTKGRYAGQVREPIKKLYGPSVLSQWLKVPVQKIGADTFNERVRIEVGREIESALSRAGLI